MNVEFAISDCIMYFTLSIWMYITIASNSITIRWMQNVFFYLLWHFFRSFPPHLQLLIDGIDTTSVFVSQNIPNGSSTKYVNVALLLNIPHWYSHIWCIMKDFHVDLAIFFSSSYKIPWKKGLQTHTTYTSFNEIYWFSLHQNSSWWQYIYFGDEKYHPFFLMLNIS